MVQPTRAGSEEVLPGQLGGFQEFSTIADPGPPGKRETKWIYPDGHTIRKTATACLPNGCGRLSDPTKAI